MKDVTAADHRKKKHRLIKSIDEIAEHEIILSTTTFAAKTGLNKPMLFFCVADGITRGMLSIGDVDPVFISARRERFQTRTTLHRASSIIPVFFGT